ncbi:hypothetical protein [Nitrosospira sp. NpAV]|uniref:hypothetical protein n=1 Tax=Nitrosospira sp. NpAV TaxID=58133 RepID=UPI00059F9643|nr:hypothetical protein [Nitrosospira sp. NpAV]KIO48284.1 hypothetical protein SQ11_12485 [Nitrosospira sp. NpAV]
MNKTKPITMMTDQQFAALAVTMNNIRKEARQSLWKLLPLILSILIFLSAVGVEIAIAYGVFSGLLQGVEDPVVQHSAGLLSLTGVMAMLTYHWLCKHNPDLWAVRLIRNLSTVFAPLYALAGGLFLSILLFPGALATATSGTPDAIFGLPVEQVQVSTMGQTIVSWLQGNMVLAAPIFVGSVTGISIMSLFVGGECIDTISTNAHLIILALLNQNAARRGWKQLLADDKACRKTASELAQLEQRSDNFIRNHAAVLAASQVEQFVRRGEAAMEAHPALFTGNDEPDSVLGRVLGKQPDLSGVKTRLDILKTHTVKHIRSVIDRVLK